MRRPQLESLGNKLRLTNVHGNVLRELLARAGLSC